MAILAALVAFGSRFAGKILTTALGWAATLLFGRVPADRQMLLLGITFGSVIWLALLIGIVVPAAGAFLLLLLPAQDLIPEYVIRLSMLAGAIIVPGVVGALTLALQRRTTRSLAATAGAVARGYPLTALLAVLLVFLAGLAVWRKGTSFARGWTDAHVPIVVTGGAYEEVANDLDLAIASAGLEMELRAAPSSMSAPARWLAAVAGRGSSELVPERLVQLTGAELDILIYPMDLLIAGKPALVNRARAAMATRLTTTAAHLTTSAEAQGLEDRLRTLAGRGSDDPTAVRCFDDAAADTLDEIDEAMADIDIPYDEWEVLYRQRLQVERDLRAASMAQVPRSPTGASDDARVEGLIANVGAVLEAGAQVALEVATDERVLRALGRLAGPRWHRAARVATVAAGVVRAAATWPANDPGVRRPIARGAPQPDHTTDGGGHR